VKHVVQADTAVTQALTAGGMWIEGEHRGTDLGGGLGKFNALFNPASTEMLGKRLANLASSLGASCVLLKEDEPTDVILAHVVARELGLRAARAINRDGLIEIVGPLGSGERVLVVADGIRDERVVDGLRAAVDRAGSTIAGFAVLVTTRALEARTGPEEPALGLAKEPPSADG
jgi:hypothetical protein